MDHARHGGCWQSNAAVCRSANRGYRSNSDKDTGFRVALVSKNITIPLSNTVDLDMIWIESGTFMMGSPADELGRDVDEFRHEVTLTQDYWIGKYEVTQAQYEAVMDSNPSEFKGTDLPVDHVSWDDAMAFCEKLTASERTAGRLPEGYEYTLPTEAQWEYACRAGTTTALNSGKNLSDKWVCPEMDEVGWYLFNSEIDDRRVTHPVGQKLPNAWGLYDMHGNVWEWCLDWYEKDYPTSAVTDPTGPKTGVHHIYRGGFYSTSADSCRSAYRCYDFSYSTGEYYGFRVVLVPVK
ncbi:MAG: formylglycine-generating enzyme family protein [Verrucomicrobia bacterium]|nr:formylglycine-generating enzyme family protein [Verrucomicrobiota bacterium]